ncbi:MAG: hypothetical protein IKI83_01435 [Prevotella sp.]|nr:hypothetical protein [Prevotella sp.]
MKYKKNLLFSILLSLSIISFSSCEKISHFFNGKEPIEKTKNDPSIADDGTNTESVSTGNQDSIAKVIKDSLTAKVTLQTKELEEKISLQSDSINNLNKRIADLDDKISCMMDKTSAFTFMIIEFILLLMVICFLYFKLNNRTKKMKGRIHELSKSQGGISEMYVNRQIQMAIKGLMDKINTKIKSQDIRIDDIVKRLIKLEYSMDSAYTQYSHTSFQHQQNEAVTQTENKKSYSVFYMPRTLINMQFDDSKKKLSKDESTYFKFTVKKHGKAEFIFDPYNDSCIVRAYDDRDNSLQTVCEIDSKSNTPRTFKNIEPGEAELRDNIWLVTKKLKLQYV